MGLTTTKRSVHSYASVVLASIALFALCGVIWAVIRPSYQVTVLRDGQGQLGDETNIEFRSFFWFSLVTMIAALVLSIGVFHRIRPRSVIMMWWLALWTLIGSFVCLKVGTSVSVMLYGVSQSDISALVPGEHISYVPPFESGIAVFFLSPFVAVLSYWLGCLVYVAPDAVDMPDTAAAVEKFDSHTRADIPTPVQRKL
ncbi:DUF2567 domain-containing protein [Corynebacterium sp. sy039]|uniref:DUF2567 domain-containing protein n=1 Tax=Corynebacterium sp. sy039 TaxID=2599641 RepID=UPI0011B7E5EC|nr:DUF2567 domain-containing protein [Corynebacterium sp. sy039]QDZ42892.1 DUF2567 domain-containing protein [Corynebacterium sp. sy039]